MFATLKNKIKEETGSELPTNMQGSQHRLSHGNMRTSHSRLSSTISLNSEEADQQQNLEQLVQVRNQCQNLSSKVKELTAQLEDVQTQKTHLEKTNSILLESVKVAQNQKDFYCDEQVKIHDLQQEEIRKLKNLLLFREQEALDRTVVIRQHEIKSERATEELERLKKFESLVETLQDELEQAQHSSQVNKNTLTSTLAAVEEENRHLKMRLKIMEDSRLDAINSLNGDEKLQSLINERKLLEQRLEEAHLQLSDIKSSWSGQNLALETQVNRLSKQVAEEASEKRRFLVENESMKEKINSLELNSFKLSEEIKQRDNKIKLLEDENEELNLSLKSCREDNEQQIIFERTKSEQYEKEIGNLKVELKDLGEQKEHVEKSLREDNSQLKKDLDEAINNMEAEKEEKLTALLRNAEISQSEELLKQELRMERNEANELHDKNCTLRAALEAQQQEKLTCQTALKEMTTLNVEYKEKVQAQEDIKNELFEKNATIKMLNQRLADLKKTLQKEFSKANGFEIHNGRSIDERTITSTATNCSKCGEDFQLGGGIIMDEVNFTYLKHVIVKFLTSREVESRHLVRAVATLLKLTRDEEKLLEDTLHWKMSWFGSKPDTKKGNYFAVSAPPPS